MRKLNNTLFITSPERYLSLEGENVVISEKGTELARFPLHNFESILTFGYSGASPRLMSACASHGVALTFLSPNGSFLAAVRGETSGNVLLRRQQYRLADDPKQSADFARNFLTGKLFNSRWVLERALRDHALRLQQSPVASASGALWNSLRQLESIPDVDSLRGVEGEAAKAYFSAFDSLILQQKEHFCFTARNRRPPTDNVNAMLSFAYVLLAHDCRAALEAVGLDPFVGFLHTDRPGRASLAMDLMEELRAPVADRFVLGLINNRQVAPTGFIKEEGGAVRMEEDTRKAFLTAWQKRKQETLTHPFLSEKLEWGLVPFAQAQLLARCIRGDLDGYPPFLWK